MSVPLPQRVHRFVLLLAGAATAVLFLNTLALADAPFDCLFFGREELPVVESALGPLLEREPGLRDADAVIVMEPTANEIHAGCLGNVNATWTFRGRSGHSARPWLADNAIERAAAGVHALARIAPAPHDFDGLRFCEVVSVTRIAGGIAGNVIPDECVVTVNFRYAPDRTEEEALAHVREVFADCGVEEFVVDDHSPGALPGLSHPAAAATMAKRALDSGIDSSLEAALELEVSHALITEHSAEVAASSEAFRSRA